MCIPLLVRCAHTEQISSLMHTTMHAPAQSWVIATTCCRHPALSVYALSQAEVFFKTFNFLSCNCSVLHCLSKQFPCGRLKAFTFTPFGQPILHCFFFVLGMGSKACCYCGCVKPHPFKDCPPLICCFSAHMLSQQHEIALMICGHRRTLYTFKFLPGDE